METENNLTNVSETYCYHAENGRPFGITRTTRKSDYAVFMRYSCRTYPLARLEMNDYMFWICVAYAISTPLAIWIDRSEEDTSIERRMTTKASSGFKGVAWMFEGAYTAYNLFWVILFGPVMVGFLAIFVVIGVPVAYVYEWATGEELFPEAEVESASVEIEKA